MIKNKREKLYKSLIGKNLLCVMLIFAFAVVALGAGSQFAGRYASAESGAGIGNTIDFAGGDGSESAPFLIATAAHLDNIRNFTYNANNYIPVDYSTLDGYYFRLIDDIDLSAYIEGKYPGGGWKPIGRTNFNDDDDLPFSGSVDGGGYTVSGLWTDRGDEYAGLFGGTYYSSFSGLNVILGDKGVSGKIYAGGLTASLYGISDRRGKIVRCRVAGSVTLKDSGMYTFFNAQSACGGITGSASNSEISESYFMGAVSGKNLGADVNAVAGIAGSSSNIVVRNCYAKAQIILDENKPSVVAAGIITTRVAVTIINCYAVITSESPAAPIVADGTIVFTPFSMYNPTATSNYYNDGMTAKDGTETDGVTALSASNIKKAASYNGWDINSADGVWGIYEGGGMPYLKCFDNIVLITPVGKVYDGKATVPAAASAGDRVLTQISDADIQVLTDCSGMIDAGDYPVDVNYPAELDFYYQISVASYVISKAELTVRAKDITRAYGKDTPDFGYEITGFANGENESVVSGLSSIIYNAPQNPKRGTHTIEISGGGLFTKNYEFTFEDGELTITGFYPHETALIVSGAAAAAALAVLAVVWFGVKKKSFADFGRGLRGIFVKEKVVLQTETVEVVKEIETIKEVPIIKKSLPADLSERERRVAELVLKGLSRREIADELAISEGAVRTYSARSYVKCGVDGQKEFIARYLGNG